MFGELEMIWRRMNDDAHSERLVRCVLTLLANDKSDFGQVSYGVSYTIDICISYVYILKLGETCMLHLYAV